MNEWKQQWQKSSIIGKRLCHKDEDLLRESRTKCVSRRLCTSTKALPNLTHNANHFMCWNDLHSNWDIYAHSFSVFALKINFQNGNLIFLIEITFNYGKTLTINNQKTKFVPSIARSVRMWCHILWISFIWLWFRWCALRNIHTGHIESKVYTHRRIANHMQASTSTHLLPVYQSENNISTDSEDSCAFQMNKKNCFFFPCKFSSLRCLFRNGTQFLAKKSGRKVDRIFS